jgi:hypothetical protein
MKPSFAPLDPEWESIAALISLLYAEELMEEARVVLPVLILT